MGSQAKVDQNKVNAQADQTANKQRDFNFESANEQARFNRPNQTNAAGNTVSWVQTGTDANGRPTFSQNTSFGDMGKTYSSGLTGLGTQWMQNAGKGLPDSTAALDKAEQFATARLDRQKGIDVAALDNRLKNQGLQPGTEAYDNAMRSTLDSYGDRRDAMTANLQGQFFNQGLQGRQQQFNELQPGITFGFNTALNTNQAPINPISVGNVDYGQIQNAAFNQQAEMVKQQNAYNNAMLGGLAGLGGGFFGGPLMSPLMKGMGNSFANYMGYPPPEK